MGKVIGNPFVREELAGKRIWDTDMSEEQIKIAEQIESAFINSFEQDVKSGIVPWAAADSIIEYMDYMVQEGLDSEDLIEYLAKRSGIGLDAFKQMWAKLTDEQKVDVLNSIAHKIAYRGLEELLKTIVDDLNRQRKYRKGRGRILVTALDYAFKVQKVDYDWLEGVIISVFWPEKKKKDETAYEDFVRGLDLANYLDEEELEELIVEHLVYGLAEKC
ncbi:MAG: hypothetical protein RXO24_08565 [Acidilobus sp.]